MRSLWYCRERRTRPIVQVTFEPGWNNVTVIYQEERLGVLASRAELETGQRYTTKDGAELIVQLPRRAGFPEVRLDGKSLLISPGDPVKVARTAFWLILFIGAVNSLIGVMALMSDAQAIKGVGGSSYSLIYGVVFLALAALVWRGSVVALATAVILYAATSGWWLYSASAAGVPISTGAVVVRGLLLLFLLWVLNVLWSATPKRSKQPGE